MLKGLKTGIMGRNQTPSEEGVCFEALQANSTVSLHSKGNPDPINLVTSTNGKNWTSYSLSSVITLLNIGDKVYFKSGGSTSFSKSGSDLYLFKLNGQIKESGNLLYLVDPQGNELSVRESMFSELFMDLGSLIEFGDLDGLYIGADGYSRMLLGCSNLSSIGNIKAISVVGHDAFNSTFKSCSKLVKGPDSIDCIATANYAFVYAFQYCSSLKSAPRLKNPSTPYYGEFMSIFSYCNSLNSISVDYTLWPSGGNSSWVRNVSANGTFYCQSTLQLKYGIDYIPENWEVIFYDILLSYELSDSSISVKDTLTTFLPEISYVRANNHKRLVKDVDYTVTFSGLELPGTGTATFTGIGDYHGTKTVTFQVAAPLISECTIEGLNTYYRETGSEIQPTPTVKNSLGVQMTSGTDYTISYSDNVQPGTATLTITGAGIYVGTKSVTFKIITAAQYDTFVTRNDGTETTSYQINGELNNNNIGRSGSWTAEENTMVTLDIGIPVKSIWNYTLYNCKAITTIDVSRFTDPASIPVCNMSNFVWNTTTALTDILVANQTMLDAFKAAGGWRDVQSKIKIKE